jgi:predicted PurR-regulated permease PerM
VASGAVVALTTTFEALSAVVVVFFIGLYGAVRPSAHASALLAAVPPHHRDWLTALAHELDAKLTRWMLGRLVAMAFVGTTCAIVFAALGVPLAMSLAVVAGLLTFVEYIGAVVSALPPLLMAFTKGPGTALAVVILFTALHAVEGYVLSPLINRRVVKIPPAVTLGGQVVLANLVGPLGLTFATPVLIVIATSVKAWRERQA